MKHRIFGKKLGRNHNERKALFTSMTRSMFTHGSIKTTEAKAKAVVSLVERLSNVIITKSELTAKRELFRYLQDQTWVNNVCATFKATFGEQSSNFTRIKRIKYRYGDNALVVSLSFVKEIKFETKKPKVEKEEKADKKAVKKIVKTEKKAIKKPVVKKEKK
ncbi:MAG: 50S ribosomal protein L17 [Candidatus Shapirobacteria bacterium]